MDLVRQVTQELASTGGVGSTIVYVRTRKETEEVALYIQEVRASVCARVFVCVNVFFGKPKCALVDMWYICVDVLDVVLFQSLI